MSKYIINTATGTHEIESDHDLSPDELQSYADQVTQIEQPSKVPTSLKAGQELTEAQKEQMYKTGTSIPVEQPQGQRQTYLQGLTQPFKQYGQELAKKAEELATSPAKQADEGPIVTGIRQLKVGPAVGLATTAIYGGLGTLANAATNLIPGAANVKSNLESNLQQQLDDSGLIQKLKEVGEKHPYLKAAVETAGTAANIIPAGIASKDLGQVIERLGAKNLTKKIAENVSDKAALFAGKTRDEGIQNAVNTITENGLQGSLPKIKENVAREIDATVKARDAVYDKELKDAIASGQAAPINTEDIFNKYSNDIINGTDEGVAVPAERKDAALKQIDNLFNEYKREGLIDETGLTKLEDIPKLKKRISATGTFSKGAQQVGEDPLPKQIAEKLYLQITSATDPFTPATAAHNKAIHNLIDVQKVVNSAAKSIGMKPKGGLSATQLATTLASMAVGGGAAAAATHMPLLTSLTALGAGAVGSIAKPIVKSTSHISTGKALQSVGRTLNFQSQKSPQNLTKIMGKFEKQIANVENQAIKAKQNGRQELVNRLIGKHDDLVKQKQQELIDRIKQIKQKPTKKQLIRTQNQRRQQQFQSLQQ